MNELSKAKLDEIGVALDARSALTGYPATREVLQGALDQAQRNCYALLQHAEAQQTEIDSLKHDLTRHMEIANSELNRAEALQAKLDGVGELESFVHDPVCGLPFEPVIGIPYIRADELEAAIK